MQTAVHYNRKSHGSSLKKNGARKLAPLKVKFGTPKRIVNGVRVIADVTSRSNPSETYAVLFIDGKFHGKRKRAVICPCRDFHFRKEGRFQSCIHSRRAKQARKAAR